MSHKYRFSPNHNQPVRVICAAWFRLATKKCKEKTSFQYFQFGMWGEFWIEIEMKLRFPDSRQKNLNLGAWGCCFSSPVGCLKSYVFCWIPNECEIIREKSISMHHQWNSVNYFRNQKKIQRKKQLKKCLSKNFSFSKVASVVSWKKGRRRKREKNQKQTS